MLGFVKQAQPTLLGAVFAIIREWHRQGKSRTRDTRHFFREWSQTLDWIVQNIFEAAPLMDGHQEAQKRVSSVEYTFLRAVALAVEQNRQIAHRLRATEIVTLCQQVNITIPGLPPERRNDASAASMAVGKALGHLFDGAGGPVTVEGFVVARHIEQASGSSEKEYESKLYIFRRSNSGATTS